MTVNTRRPNPKPKTGATKTSAPRSATRPGDGRPSDRTDHARPSPPPSRPDVDELLADARDRAADVVGLAHEDAGRLLAAAEARARAIVERAGSSVEAARAEADGVRAEAESTATRLLHSAGAEAERITAKAREEAAAALEQAARDANQTRTAAERDAVRARSTADDEADAARAAVRGARDRARVILAEADALVDRRREEAAALHAVAVEAAGRTHVEARERAHDIVVEARTVRREADDRLDHATTEAARLVEQARADAVAVAEEAARRHVDTVRDRAETEARRLIAAAERDAGDVRADADLVMERATAAEATWTERASRKARRAGWFGRVGACLGGLWRFAPWLALAAAVGLTASGEYQLAGLVGFPGAIAALLPVAIDIYAIVAFRVHRDVPGALILMILSNALYHLAENGLFGVIEGPDGHPRPTWWLVVVVSALIPPYVVWRVHHLLDDPTDNEDAHARDDAHTHLHAQRPDAQQTGAHRSGAHAQETGAQPTAAHAHTDARRSSAQSGAQARPEVTLTVERAQRERAQVPASRRRAIAPATRPERAGGSERGGPSERERAASRRDEHARQDDVTRRLFLALGRRPEAQEIVDALVDAGLPTVSRATAQRVRERVEADPRLRASVSASDPNGD